MNLHESFMLRCLELARMGTGYTAPNPMVGAVLVYEGRIIGEGYHQAFGKAHAEVICIGSVREEDRTLIPQSTLYVSLEPCAHHGKTPPCTDLIISMKIPRVVIGSRDPFEEVNGRGIEKLRAAGLEIELGILEGACVELNRRFFTYQVARRPFVLLKWAQTCDGFISRGDHTRLLISGEITNRLVHRWRSEEAAILVGTHTALWDDPSLSVRNWQGPQPVRVVVDMHLNLPATLQIFRPDGKVIVYNGRKQGQDGNCQFRKIDHEAPVPAQILEDLFSLGIQSVMVEGGSIMLESFIQGGSWDEARIIVNEKMHVEHGTRAPVLRGARLHKQERIFSDLISYYRSA